MTFMQLMKQLEQTLGYHQWPVNSCARRLHDVFESSPVNGELTIKIMRALYKANRCQKFADKVSLEQCNTALVPIRLDVVRGQTTDIDAYQFMDQVCHAVHDALTRKLEAVPAQRQIQEDKAEIVSLKPGNSTGLQHV